MNAPSVQDLLRSWETGRDADPVRRSLALLQAGWPEQPAEAWGSLPIGERDAWLLSLYERLFGSRLETVTPCPACGERLEAGFQAGDIRAGMAPPGGASDPALDGTVERSTEVAASATAAFRTSSPEMSSAAAADNEANATRWRPARLGAWRLHYRAPTSDDLLQVLAATAAPDAAPVHLLALCTEELHVDGRPALASDLPPDVAGLLQRRMAELDPGADIQISLRCAACSHAFESRFDIGAYLWGELDDWAERTLIEVHTLASAYGWSEQDILALSAVRRQHYLGLVAA